MANRPEFLENSVIIGAHPDDELLWFNSILHQVDQTIIVYCDLWAQPEFGPKRREAIAELPLKSVTCLGIPEAGSYGCGDWTDPTLSPYGMAFGVEAKRRAATRFARQSLSVVQIGDTSKVPAETVSAAYERNYRLIRAALTPILSPDMNVFTHNPWGEYGHEDHIQVHKVLCDLREEIGFKLWMSNYCTERALPLAMRYFRREPVSYIRLPTDKAFAERVADVYRKHDVWTWADDWSWFEEECFMEMPASPAGGGEHRHLFPLNFFTIEPERQRRWLPLALGVSAASAALAVTLSETI